MAHASLTVELVQRLPASGAVVVANSDARRRCIEQVIRDVRGHEVARASRVVVISTPREATWKLAGLSSPITFDHDWRAHVSPETAEHATALAHACNAIAMIDAKVRVSSEASSG